MAIRSQGHSTSPYDSVMGNTGRNTGVTDYDPPLPEGYGARGVIAGGQITYGGGNPYTNQMQYITIATTGDAVNFGDFTVNGGIVNIPSFSLRPGDVIEVREKSKALESITDKSYIMRVSDRPSF